MLKHKFVYKNIENNITLPLLNNYNFIESNNFISEDNYTDDNIIDLEINKFTLINTLNLTFRFFNGNVYNNNFISAGFTEDEINLSNKAYRYSYFLIQVYNTFDSKNQILLHTGYIPIYLFPNKTISTYNINSNELNKEFNNLYISNIHNIINNEELFVKFSFFNAKTGRIQLFYNQSSPLNTEERVYYKIIVNNTNKTYYYLNNNIIASQFLNEEFLNRINDRNKTENKSPIFTQGNLFNIDGDYI